MMPRKLAPRDLKGDVIDRLCQTALVAVVFLDVLHRRMASFIQRLPFPKGAALCSFTVPRFRANCHADRLRGDYEVVRLAATGPQANSRWERGGVTVAPALGALLIEIWMFMPSQSFLQRYSPMPVDCGQRRPFWPVNPFSNTRGRSAAGMPTPLSPDVQRGVVGSRFGREHQPEILTPVFDRVGDHLPR